MGKDTNYPKACIESLTSERADELIKSGLWNFSVINLERAHKISRGEGVNVAIIDSAVDGSHPELKGVYKDGIDFALDSDNDEDNSHGTFVAGILAGKRTGIAPRVNIYSLKVYNKGPCDPDPIKSAIRWCLSEEFGVDIDIINISLGSPRYYRNIADICMDSYERINVPIVAAAGNNYCGTFFPASNKGVISVVSVEEKNGGLAHCYSSNVWPTADVSAPGDKILSIEPGKGYCIGDGTSAAAPHVTGVLALGISVLKKEKKLVSAKKLKRLLKKTAVKLRDFEEAKDLARKYDPQRKILKSKRKVSSFMFGAGLVQADKFLEELYRKL